MKTLRIVTFLIIYVIITFFWMLYNSRHALDEHTVSDILQLPAIWVFPIFMVIIGLILSRFYSFLKKAKQNYFVFGQLACIALTFLVFVYTFISDWQHEKQFGNFDYNRASRDDTFFPADTAYQGRAFDALESNFTDKNSFRIVELLSSNIDTTINSQKEKVYISWFKYYLEKNPTKFLCAKYYVFNDTVINEYINSDSKENLNFRFRHSSYLDSLLKVAEHIK
jgi:hypothetical protein